MAGSALFAFLLGLVVGCYATMAAYTLGKWRRHSGYFFWRWRAGGKETRHELRGWKVPLIGLFLLVMLPVGVLHDAVRPNRPWIKWSEPDA